MIFAKFKKMYETNDPAIKETERWLAANVKTGFDFYCRFSEHRFRARVTLYSLEDVRLFRSSFGRDWSIGEFICRDFQCRSDYHYFVLKDTPDLYDLVDGQWVIIAGYDTGFMCIACDEAASVMLRLAGLDSMLVERQSVINCLNQGYW